MTLLLKENHPIITICKYSRFAGLFPFDLIERKGTIFLKFSLKYLIWSVFVAFSLFAISIASIKELQSFWDDKDLLSEKVPIYRDFFIANVVGNVLTAFSSIVFMTTNKRYLELFINSIIQVDRNFDRIKIIVIETKTSKLIGFGIMAFMTFVSVFHATVHLQTVKEPSWWRYILCRVHYYISYYFNILLIFIYWNLLMLVKSRIVALKDALKFLKNDILGTFSMPEQVFEHDFKNIINYQKKKGYRNFKRLFDVYKHIFEAAEALDKLFCIVLMVLMLNRFFAMIISPYVLYTELLLSFDESVIYSQCFWISGDMLAMMMMLEPGHSCMKEHEEVKQVLSKLACSKNFIHNEDLEVFYELIRTCAIQFHIFDMVTINRSILASILGGLTTYIVILFQLNSS